MKAETLFDLINESKNLKKLQIEGLKRGEQRGKSMNWDTNTIRGSLNKQIKDWQESYQNHDSEDKEHEDEKRRLADIINVASLLFLRLDGIKI